ncbi:MAG: hypothetical protein RL577_1063 [Bacteroidota bacterium]
MKNNPFPIIFTSLFVAASLTACERNEEGELITTVGISLQQDSLRVEAKFEDLDGPGGQEPIQPDTLYLTSGTWEAAVEFWNNSVDPSISITDEIQNEAEEHLVCWEWIPELVSDAQALSIQRIDLDANGLELGLNAKISVLENSHSQGQLLLRLMHQPDLKNGSCALGETDVEVIFPVRW